MAKMKTKKKATGPGRARPASPPKPLKKLAKPKAPEPEGEPARDVDEVDELAPSADAKRALKDRLPKLELPKVLARAPVGAVELKARLGKLASLTGEIRALKRSLGKNFYEIGQILREIEVRKLYEAKGYSSFEAFVERELDIGKQLSLKIARIAHTFLRDAALAIGLERLSAALDAMDSDQPAPAAPESSPPPGRSPIPIHKQ